MFFIQMPAAMPIKAKGKDGITNMNDLPVGYMGRMMIYKSGAVKMKLGDAIFDVSFCCPALIRDQNHWFI